MPKTKQTTERTQIRLPKPLSNEVDRIVEKYPIYHSRQSFVENAIREKIEKVWEVEAGLQCATGQPHGQNRRDSENPDKDISLK